MYAEEVGHYWKTGTSAPDTWMDKAKKQIENLDGKVLAEGYGSDHTGRSAYMLGFQIGDETYKIVWPVLESKSGNNAAARRQAATMLFHDVKAKTVSAHVLGARVAFFSYLMLPTGQTASEASMPELAASFPKLLE